MRLLQMPFVLLEISRFFGCKGAQIFAMQQPFKVDSGRAMSALNREQVLSVRHWTDSLFSFTTTRDASFRFQSGQFAMMGLEVEGRPLLRAYSMASAHYEDNLSSSKH